LTAMKFAAAICLLLAAATLARSEIITPLNAGLREEADLWVTCALTAAPRPGEIPLLQSKAECESATGIYHYKLWLPRGYLTQTQRRWPCIFIASPFGNAGMGNMAERLKRTYVVVMLVESRNGPWPSPIGNFLAAHDDVVKRIRIREGAKIATGLSGGARASSVFVQLRPGFAGVVLQGAGVARTDNSAYYFNHIARVPSILFALLIGASDPRRSEISELQHEISPDHLAILIFPGGHQWAPADSFAKALDWIESRTRSASS
jgi:hypothetical protein